MGTADGLVSARCEQGVASAVAGDVGLPAPAHQEGQAGRELAAASNTEIAYLPTGSSWMNRIEAQFTALREFTLYDADHATHREQGSMIRRDIAWGNRHTNDPRLRHLIGKANVA